MFLSSILIEIFEKNISFNLIKIILKFDFVLITCSRSLEIGLVPLASLEELFWISSSGELGTCFYAI